MNKIFKRWLGRSLTVAMLLGSSQSAIALAPATIQHQFAPTNTERSIAMLDTLELVTWQLVSYRAEDGSSVEAFADRPATFQFQDGRLSGTTGCNRFFSAYTRDGETLTIETGGSTLMACFPEALAAQETAILRGLPQVTSFAQASDQLTLLNSEGTTLFTLIPQPTAELTHTEWTLTLYNNGRGGLATPLAETTITANFDEEKRLAGSAGCNNYRASYTLDNNTITVGPASSTRRLCNQPNGIMQQESEYLALLQDVATYTISGHQLDLKNTAGTTLARFTAN